MFSLLLIFLILFEPSLAVKVNGLTGDSFEPKVIASSTDSSWESFNPSADEMPLMTTSVRSHSEGGDPLSVLQPVSRGKEEPHQRSIRIPTYPNPSNEDLSPKHPDRVQPDPAKWAQTAGLPAVEDDSSIHDKDVVLDKHVVFEVPAHSPAERTVDLHAAKVNLPKSSPSTTVQETPRSLRESEHPPERSSRESRQIVDLEAQRQMRYDDEIGCFHECLIRSCSCIYYSMLFSLLFICLGFIGVLFRYG
ncbi:hypothetical protein PGT21_003665 [Puccinia graminis f. sp. tritici]|uniref:Uncharacterized protein n=1 Tax=Puccinia graminis f. sp. tritici TaxID=56615 RepID=A0A5B0MJI7_PUCGR|nr:hypothetical protein PGT21_003665 [Puccinia graminis f. sp. tritici]